MKLKTVIADDEPLARERLRLLLSGENVEIVSECRNSREVEEILRNTPVDLLLLDIQMPGMTGFEVIEKIGLRNMPTTVFVTAYSEFAVKAFEVQALDYIVKPVDPERLREAVERAREKIRLREAFATQEQLASVWKALHGKAGELVSYPQRLLAKNGDKESVVRVSDIEWIEAADYYVSLHVAGKQHLLREAMKALEKRLDPKKFVRLHRSAIVNIDYVREIHRDGRTDGWVLLSTGARVRMNKAGWHKLAALHELTSG